MSDKKRELFSKEARDRISSPDRLNELMQVVNVRVWFPLSAIGSLLAIGLLWSIFGRIPITVKGQGLLINPGDVVELQSSSGGQILDLNIQPGDIVTKKDIVATIKLPQLRQQLDRQQTKLSELQIQHQQANELTSKQLKLQREDLEKQKENLEKTLERESIVPVLRQENLELLAKNRRSLENSLRNTQKLLPVLRQQSMNSIAQRRETLELRLEQIRNMLPTLKERIEARRKLLEKQLITGDALLSAEREYFKSLTELSQQESQLSELDLQETNSQQQYLDNLNKIDQIQAQIQELEVQETTTQRQYLESLNKIDEINAKLEQNQTELAKIARQELETKQQQFNQIQELRRDIARLEQEIVSKTKIESEYQGRVLDVGVVSGQVIDAGTSIAVIQKQGENQNNSTLMSIAYFADRDGKKIKPGMKIQVTPSIVKRERYGGIVGKVTEVSSFPVTTQNIGVVIGNREIARSLSQSFSQTSSMIIQISAELELDPNTESGYKWSSSNGPPTTISPATTTLVRVQIGSRAPISYVIPLFRSWTGIY